mgnify:CR=1
MQAQNYAEAAAYFLRTTIADLYETVHWKEGAGPVGARSKSAKIERTGVEEYAMAGETLDLLYHLE